MLTGTFIVLGLFSLSEIRALIVRFTLLCSFPIARSFSNVKLRRNVITWGLWQQLLATIRNMKLTFHFSKSADWSRKTSRKCSWGYLLVFWIHVSSPSISSKISSHSERTDIEKISLSLGVDTRPDSIRFESFFPCTVFVLFPFFRAIYLRKVLYRLFYHIGHLSFIEMSLEIVNTSSSKLCQIHSLVTIPFDAYCI